MKRLSEIKNLNELDEEVKENTSPLRAVRLKCLDCSSYQLNEVKECNITNCPLHPFRLGKNPFRKRELTEEQKEAMAERMRKIVKNK